ncbi:MAG: hypothetical protein AB1641_13225 [Thermodesulfobacteriota bacterium]
MKPIVPSELEQFLFGEFSHLILKSNSPETIDRLREHFRHQGLIILRELVFRDQEQQTWLLFSFDQPGLNTLVLELIELGLAEEIAGIEAKST